MNEPTDSPTPRGSDRSGRFLFEDADIRGETVHLDTAFRDIINQHQYAPAVNRLLGEFLAAAVLLSTTLKFEGKLVLQARSEGQIALIMAECDHQLQLRAIARGAQQATADRFEQLLQNGQLAITIDPLRGERYQGIVPLSATSLAHSLDAYFEQSEQLHTRFWLAADEDCAAGLLLQQLPGQLVEDSEARERQWRHVCSLAQTLQPEELRELDTEQLLYRLYHEDRVRLFQPVPVSFRCNCSRDRTFNALASLERAEVEDLLEELGSITMDCEFCNQQYRFVREDLAALLGEDESKTLH